MGQTARLIEPCTSTTSSLPARVWRVSMFCVTTARTWPPRSSAASARWPSFGSASSSAWMRPPYQRQTRSGSRRKASIEATSKGSTSAQSPVADLKSGIPLSVLMPAPVSTTHEPWSTINAASASADTVRV